MDPLPGAPIGRYRYWSGTRWTEHLAGQVQAPMAPAPAPRSPRVRLGMVVLVLAVIALIAVGGYFVSDSGGDDSGSYPAAWDPQVAPLAKEVESLRGLTFDHPVPVHYLTDEEFRKRVAVDDEKFSPAARRRIRDTEATMRALGLIDAQTDLAKAQDTVNQSSIAAFYSNRTKEIVIRGTGPLDAYRKATLAHELTHVLQDQHFDLNQIRYEAATSKTASSGALLALIEGDAERIKGKYLDRLSPTDHAAYEQARSALQAQFAPEQSAAPEILEVGFDAPYIFGPDALKVLEAEGGNGAVDDALRAHEVNDTMFLDASAVLHSPDADAVATPSISGGRRIGRADTLGAFDLYTLLASRVDRQLALDAADTWAGDRYVAYRTSAGDTCVRVTVASRTVAGATTLGRAMDQWAAAMPGASISRDSARRRITLTSCDGKGTVAAPDSKRLEAAVSLLQGRNGTLASLVGRKYPLPVAECVSHDYIKAPAFLAVIDLTDAELTPAQRQALKVAGDEVVSHCRASAT